MSELRDRPSVHAHEDQARKDHAPAEPPPAAIAPPRIATDELLEICREAGADDTGLVAIDREELGDERAHAELALPGVRTLIAFVVRMNRGPIRSPLRSVANLEFHHTGEHTDDTGRRIVRELERRGIAALNPSMGFPMEMDRFPGRIWVISHKIVAQAAGLGRIGIHRNLIHPRFGNFVLLGTVLTTAEVDRQTRPIDYNPCLECKLCVAACPVGAIGADGHFDFSACYHHNYREFMGGYTEQVERVAGSRSARALRRKTTDAESASMWQSLSFGANYKAAYCLAVCPAGEDVIGPFRGDRGAFVQQTLKPLQRMAEPVYVVRHSDAEAHVRARFPHKQVRHIAGSLRPSSAAGFLRGLPIAFQRGRAAGLCARYHFRFTGPESIDATVVIDDGAIRVTGGLEGNADLTVTADARTWIEFLREGRGLLLALVRRRIKVRGKLALLPKFARCFPS